MITARITALTALVVPMVCQAQVVEQAIQTKIRPVISRDSEGFSSCGLNVLVYSKDSKNYIGYIFSITAEKEGIGLGIVSSISAPNGSATPPSKVTADIPEPSGFWIGLANSAKVARLANITKMADAGYAIGSFDLDVAFESIHGILQGKLMQVSLSRPSDTIERIYQFSANASDLDKQAMYPCLRDVGKRALVEISKFGETQN